MDEDTKKIMEDIRQSLEGLARAANEISEYLTYLRQQRTPPAPVEAPADARKPYLAGRQPRRDGDSYGTVPRPSTGGAYGTQTKGTVKHT
jgi:hypothetical protein